MFRVLLQAVMFLLAIAVGLSRIGDYYHHWSDVVAAALIGAFTAWLIVSNSYKQENIFILSCYKSFFPSLAHRNDEQENCKAARNRPLYLGQVFPF